MINHRKIAWALIFIMLGFGIVFELIGCAMTSQNLHYSDGQSYKVKGIAFGKANVAALQSTMHMLEESSEGYDTMIEINQESHGIAAELESSDVAGIIAKILALGAL